MPLAVNIVVTFLLWAFLIGTILRYAVNGKRDRSLHGKIAQSAAESVRLVERHAEEIERLNSEWSTKLEQNSLSKFRELQAKYPVSPAPWGAPFHDSAPGLCVESAVYGAIAQGEKRTIDVTDKVKKLLPEGSGQFVVRHRDFDNADIFPDVFKFLTVTVSITQSQERLLIVPSLPDAANMTIAQVRTSGLVSTKHAPILATADITALPIVRF